MCAVHAFVALLHGDKCVGRTTESERIGHRIWFIHVDVDVDIEGPSGTTRGGGASLFRRHIGKGFGVVFVPYFFGPCAGL